MTYIDYINRFMELNQDETFTAYDFALYATLLHTANRKGWPAEFECPTKRLLDGIKGMAKQTMLSSRERLRERGLIEYEAGERNSTSPVYRLLAPGKNRGKKSAQKVAQKRDQKVDQNQDENQDQRQKVDQKVDQNIDPYIRLKTKDYIERDNSAGEIFGISDPKQLLTDEQLLALFFGEQAPYRTHAETLCMQWHTTMEVLEQKAREVLTEWHMTGESSRNQNEQRRHFINHLRKKIQEENREVRQPQSQGRTARKQAAEPRSVNDRWSDFSIPGTDNPETPTT